MILNLDLNQNESQEFNWILNELKRGFDPFLFILLGKLFYKIYKGQI